MSATGAHAGDPRVLRRPGVRRRGTAAALAVRAFLASRLIVLGAGITAALALPRVGGWSMFDPMEASASLGAVGNVLAAPAVRWDSIHYLAIAQRGYTTVGSTVFFPLYPLLIRVAGYVSGSDVIAGVLISTVSFVTALLLLHRLAELELGEAAANATLLLIAFAPLSFFFTAVYSESLFLALSVGSVYAARRERWAVAASLGGLAAITRVPGVLLVIPLAITYLERRRRLDRRLGWMLIVPAALLAYLGFVAARGYPPLSPFTQQAGAVHQHRMTNPVDTIIAAVRAAWGGVQAIVTGHGPVYDPSVGGPLLPGAESIVLLLVLIVAVAALTAAFQRLPVAYGCYAAAALLLCIWSPVTRQPLQSLDRYTLTIFPLWMAAGVWAAERRLTRAAVLLGGALLAFWTFQFATWAFVA